MAIRIPYGDSGSLTPRFDSSSYSFGSIIYFDGQIKVGGLVFDSADIVTNRLSISTLFKDSDISIITADSNDIDILFDEVSIIAGNFTGSVNAESIVVPSSLFKNSNLSAIDTFVKDVPEEAGVEETGPTQVWIG